MMGTNPTLHFEEYKILQDCSSILQYFLIRSFLKNKKQIIHCIL